MAIHDDKTTQETSDHQLEALSERMHHNLHRMEDLSRRMMAALANKRMTTPSVQAPSPQLFARAWTSWWAEWMSNPSRMMAWQVGFWSDTLRAFAEAQQNLARGQSVTDTEDAPKDPRFSNPLWHKHPYFNFVRGQYLRNAEAIQQAVGELPDLDPKERRRIAYFSQQLADMLSPTNFLATNPDALERALETEGESLVRGMENLVSDLERGQGDLLVRLADEEAFAVGENLATTEGSVVYRNHLFELIQYAPRTETVSTTPLVIFPPWINKFYIMDLKEKNSLIRWITEQGMTLFVVSWVNPDASYRDIGLEDYITDGYLTALEEIKAITGEEQINAVGYCIAGTTLSLVLALLKARGDRSIKSATFFTTLTDFSDQGEFEVFLTDDFVDGIEHEIDRNGFLDSFFMSRTFSFLRSRDLIYQPAVRNYMMGETPPAFDLLYWNGDSTNLPGKMAVQYLRHLCQENRFANEGISLLGETLKLSDVTVPVCAIGCETDHIAAWKASFNGVRQMGSRSKQFILSESGHIAGIINPPTKQKYGHYTNPKLAQSPEDWQAGAEKHAGSWWPRWMEWLKKKSGKQVPARQPGGPNHPALAPAPGTYVRAQPGDVSCSKSA